MTNKVILTRENDFQYNKLSEDIMKDKHILVYVKRESCPYCSMMQGEWNKLCDKVKGDKNLLVVEIDKNVFKPERTPKFMSDLVRNTNFVPNVVMTRKAYQVDGINSYLGFEKNRTVDNLLEFVNTMSNTTKPRTKSSTETITGAKKTDSKKTDSKKTDSKKIDSKKKDSKKTDSKKQTPRKQILKKQILKKQILKK